MKIKENVSLKPYNTFGIEAGAARFAEVHSEVALIELLDAHTPELILGGGSNILFHGDVQGLVIKNNILGKQVIDENDETVQVRFGAGENWHECVLWAIENGYGGIENLSLIPGTVGAAPMQNIGAYGVELKDVFVELEAVHLREKTQQTFNHAACKFAYRESVFKKELKGQFFITAVTLQLTKKNHKLNTSYGAIQTTLEKNNIKSPDIKSISDAVIQIRQSKLPDPTKLGNAGSFFKNPIIPKSQFDPIKLAHSGIVSYDLPDDMVKVPAGWLIEQCGWKGKQIGDAGTYKNQALVIVNHGKASGEDIWQLAQKIQQSVNDKFGIKLTPEVNVF